MVVAVFYVMIGVCKSDAVVRVLLQNQKEVSKIQMSNQNVQQTPPTEGNGAEKSNP